ncbi:Transcriptional corepressor LEUNIG [Apostasia shenzhenica]|uniref:Transcriptional corepressor LEUNIG n=1 Tax=Apostasia shenzhenica TaxID=1088818 RepID=A0A2I0AHN1_9ASPA|nr:Transcriptional corepressor LEUNIG [Apostasia shenzhenica]
MLAAIDAPKGFLFEWWSVFWDIFIARTNEKHSESAAAYIEAQQMKVKEQQQRQQLHIHQLIQHRNPQMQHRDINHIAINNGINSLISEGSLMPSAASLLSGKLYEDHSKTTIPMDSGVSPRLPDARMGLLKSTTNHPGLDQDFEQLSRNLVSQVQRPAVATNQFPLASPQQQPLTLLQAQGNIADRASYGDMDPRRLWDLGRGALIGKDGKPIGNDGSLGSPVQAGSPSVSRQDQDLMKARNNVVPISSPPLNPSAQIPSDGIAVAGSFPRTSSMSKSMVMYSADGIGGLPSSSNHLKLQDDLEHFGNGPSLEDQVESFLSQDEDATELFSTLKGNHAEHSLLESCWHVNSMDYFQAWDDQSFVVNTYTGHSSHVASLDFHPIKKDLLCSCDVNGEIRFWSASLPFRCSRVSKGASSQVRFQPRVGLFLAATSDNMVSILDVETDRKITTIPAHNHELQYICWHANGDYLAVVSQDIVRVWSMASETFVHELSSNGNKFRSCIFHPSYTNFLVIGGYQTLQLWDMVENRTTTVQAHDDLIAGLARSSQGMIASVSHDNYVKKFVIPVKYNIAVDLSIFNWTR